MDKNIFQNKETALVIVAHPDDETIWMGGLILKYDQLDWTIFSLCRLSDPDRAPKFIQVCKFYGAKSLMTDLEDEGKLKVAESVPVIEKLISEKIKTKKYDHIFTHGQNGEYGHSRHKGVHQAVKNLIDRGELVGKDILYFDYVKNAKYSLKPGKKPDLEIKLSQKLFNRKKQIMTAIYGFDPKGIDANLCTNPEAFKIFNKKNTPAYAKASAGKN